MKNVIPETVLEITPTNIKYTNKSEEINKTFLLTKNKLKNSLLKMDFSCCDFKKEKDDKLNNNLPPMSFVFFKLFAQKTKIPEPKNITDKYLEVFCKKIDTENYCLQEKFIVNEQINFNYNDIFYYICSCYSECISILMLLAGISESHLDLDMFYEYKSNIENNIAINVIYNNCIFLFTLSENIHNILNNKTYLKELEQEYDKSFVISTYTIDKKNLEKTNNIIYYNNNYDNILFNKMLDIYDKYLSEKKEELEIKETKLDFETEPFYIVGLDNITYF